MTITFKKEVKEQLEIAVPSFHKSKNGRKFLGVLDEKTLVEIYHNDDIMHLSNSNIAYCDHVLKNIPEDYHSCTETEFLDKYAEVERLMSLHPILMP